MEESLVKYLLYYDIMGLLKYIYGMVKATLGWFKEFINTITLKGVFRIFNSYLCINELNTMIVTINVDENMAVRENLALLDTLEYLKKKYETGDME